MDIPLLGYGTWKLAGDTCIKAVTDALEIGYRHIDTAHHYENHKEINKAILDSGIPREEIFLSTKVWRDRLWKQYIIDEGKRACDELGTDYLDLFMIHWPNQEIPIEETLEGFQELYQLGLIHKFGVSNFTHDRIKELIRLDSTPYTNQIEYHPSFHENDLVEYCQKNQILITAYCPLGQGKDLQIPHIQMLAEKYECSPAQIILAWIRQQGIAAIPKATSKEFMQNNWDSQQITLSEDDIHFFHYFDSNTRLVRKDFDEFGHW
jgi:2,5-diketo-D-gluconate reductase B